MTRTAIYTFGGAILMAGLVGLMTGAQPDLWSRVLIGAALILVSRDAIEAAWLGAQPARINSARAWVHIWLFAALFVNIMMVITWTGAQVALADLMRHAGIGAVVGAAVTLIPALRPRHRPLTPAFETSRPADASLLGRFVFYGWPIVATAMIAGVTLDPPDGGWNGVYPLFQLAFLPFLVVLFPIKGGVLANWPDHLPRILGYVLLITALISS